MASMTTLEEDGYIAILYRATHGEHTVGTDMNLPMATHHVKYSSITVVSFGIPVRLNTGCEYTL